MSAGRLWAISLAVLLGGVATIAALSDPVLFLWYAAIALVLSSIAALILAAMWHERAVTAESDLMFATRPVEVVGSKGTRLQLVTQRTGDHDALPVADGFFPVHDRIEDDELTDLIRATEER